MNSSLIGCAHTHTGTLHWHWRQLIRMQTRGEINANRSKGNKQERHREKRGRASLSQHRLLHWEEMEASTQSCRLDGWECDGFSTDPGWAGSGSLSCRENGASPAPGSSGPSSRSLQPWFNSRLHERQRCQQPLHNHGQGLARQQIPLLSISARTNTCTLTSRQHSGGRAVQVPPPLPSRSQSPAHLRRRWGGGGHWSRAETGLSNHPVRPAPTPWPPPLPPPLLWVTDYSRKVKW